MRTFDKFENINSFDRVVKNSTIIYDISRCGATKVNTVFLFIEATISIFECINSYMVYQQAKERNNQLEQYLYTLKVEFKNLLKTFELEKQALKSELEQKRERIEKELKNNRSKFDILKKALNISKEYLTYIKGEVEAYRRKFPFKRETREIEKKYYEAMNRYLEVNLQYI